MSKTAENLIALAIVLTFGLLLAFAPWVLVGALLVVLVVVVLVQERNVPPAATP
jgi:hypothetical protein